MIATNHALAGAAIAIVIKEPILALPLALISHFALDVLPHFGMHTWEDRRRYPKLFKSYFIVEAILLILLFVTIWLLQVPWLLYACSIVAMSPDFAWGYRFVIKERLGKKSPGKMNRFNQWHSDIQTRESIRPGIYIEAAFVVCLASFVIGQSL